MGLCWQKLNKEEEKGMALAFTCVAVTLAAQDLVASVFP